MAQVGTEIVHFFTDSDEETGKPLSIYATGTISKVPLRGKRGKLWVMYEDGEFSHELLEKHYGRLWSFIEFNLDYEYGPPESPFAPMEENAWGEEHAPVSSVGAQPVDRAEMSDNEDDLPLCQRSQVRRVTC